MLETTTKETRMIVRKALLAAAGAAALAATPAWALPGRGEGPGRPHGRDTAPGQTRDLPGRAGRGPAGSPQSHRCTPHAVAYVAAGRLVSHTLVLNGSEPTPTVARAARGPHGPTYSGDVTIDVARTNRHARADKGTTKTYTLDRARILLRTGDQNGDGNVDVADAVPGSRAKVIGKVTRLARRCDQTGFTPELTIRKLLVHAPPAPES